MGRLFFTVRSSGRDMLRCWAQLATASPFGTMGNGVISFGSLVFAWTLRCSNSGMKRYWHSSGANSNALTDFECSLFRPDRAILHGVGVHYNSRFINRTPPSERIAKPIGRSGSELCRAVSHGLDGRDEDMKKPPRRAALRQVCL